MGKRAVTALADDALRRARGRPEVAVQKLRSGSRGVLRRALALLDSGVAEDHVLGAVNQAAGLLRAARQVRGFGGGHPADGRSGVSNIYGSNARSMYPTKGPRYSARRRT